MPDDDGGGLGPKLQERLREELERVQPRFSSPRYLSAKNRRVAWRLAPAALAASLVGILGLSAYATTGSTNPVVWTHRVQTVLNPPATSPEPSEHRGSPKPAVTPERHESPEPSEKPISGESPEPDESPESGDGHSGSGSGGSGSSGSGSGGSGSSGSGSAGGSGSSGSGSGSSGDDGGD